VEELFILEWNQALNVSERTLCSAAAQLASTSLDKHFLSQNVKIGIKSSLKEIMIVNVSPWEVMKNDP